MWCGIFKWHTSTDTVQNTTSAKYLCQCPICSYETGSKTVWYDIAQPESKVFDDHYFGGGYVWCGIFKWHISSALAMGILQSCTKQLIWLLFDKTWLFSSTIFTRNSTVNSFCLDFNNIYHVATKFCTCHDIEPCAIVFCSDHLSEFGWKN